MRLWSCYSPFLHFATSICTAFSTGSLRGSHFIFVLLRQTACIFLCSEMLLVTWMVLEFSQNVFKLCNTLGGLGKLSSICDFSDLFAKQLNNVLTCTKLTKFGQITKIRAIYGQFSTNIRMYWRGRPFKNGRLGHTGFNHPAWHRSPSNYNVCVPQCLQK